MYEHFRSLGSEQLPGDVLSDLEGRIATQVIITKDQLLNMAAEKVDEITEKVGVLIGHLEVLAGFAEWDEIRRRRRRTLAELSMAYLVVARQGTGSLVPESLGLHGVDLAAMHATRPGSLLLECCK
ncbi:unnamed protein product [Symbiodinium sp. CCMP2456]|nr:unnamed protein product [Symbiodinium sp. CCMP2456]